MRHWLRWRGGFNARKSGDIQRGSCDLYIKHGATLSISKERISGSGHQTMHRHDPATNQHSTRSSKQEMQRVRWHFGHSGKNIYSRLKIPREQATTVVNFSQKCRFTVSVRRG
ncbi:uncharacterized protein LOC144821867 isoform X2 [Lissotriton helveticus]